MDFGPSKPFQHRFSLRGMKVGDWFLGCTRCWQQYPPNSAGPNYCCQCGGKVLIYNLGPHNAAEVHHHNLPIPAGVNEELDGDDCP